MVHCNYGSIWLRFRDMTRDRQTDRQTDRRADRHPHRFMIWPHIVGHIISWNYRERVDVGARWPRDVTALCFTNNWSERDTHVCEHERGLSPADSLEPRGLLFELSAVGVQSHRSIAWFLWLGFLFQGPQRRKSPSGGQEGLGQSPEKQNLNFRFTKSS